MTKREKPGFSAIDVANLAKITLTEPYPSRTAWNTNTRSNLFVYVLQGSVLYVTPDEERILLKKGNAILVGVGTAYRWVPVRKVTFLVLSIPPWSAEQQRIS